ncbi:hypothetical protein KKF73_01820 [Patescibacteria group bacterium]|nr:hypothetical protein [Patescibacteria group bacterium]
MVRAPILAIILLMLLRHIDLQLLQEAIIGVGTLEPWKIIVIFFSMAYVSLSVDVTGLFDWLAYKLVHLAKGSGLKLFLIFYIFASVLTIFTSNDIVILTLTPIIYYVGKHAKINVIHLLFAEFFAANTWSMMLLVGNPTNIIMASALQIDFLEYLRVMLIPTIVAGVTNFALLYLLFKKAIHKNYSINIRGHAYVRGWADALLSTAILLLCLASLAVAPYIGLEIWQAAAIFAAVFVIEDLAFGYYYFTKAEPLAKMTRHKIESLIELHELEIKSNEFYTALHRMPWKLLPFIVSFFILIAALNKAGVVDHFATFISSLSTTLSSGIFANGISSFILANVVNNQPMTIFMANTVLSPNFAVTPNILEGSAYATVIASNLGANLTLLGALAGLMWHKLLKNKNIKITYWDFLKKGILITPIVFVITLITLYLTLS